MTEQEIYRLNEAHRIALENQEKVDEMYSAFFERTAAGDKPFYERVAKLVRGFETGSLVAKWAVRFIIGIGAIAAAISATILAYQQTGGPPK